MVHEDSIIAHAREEAPRECCGVLLSTAGQKTRHFRVRNQAASRYEFLMDIDDLFQVCIPLAPEGWRIQAIYHSHPAGPAYPSTLNLKMSLIEDVYCVIVSLLDPNKPDVRAYLISDHIAIERPLAEALA